jgi:hypothetical protein
MYGKINNDIKQKKRPTQKKRKSVKLINQTMKTYNIE